jgi:menaquinone-dependent protoporphyrinogen oxidase
MRVLVAAASRYGSTVGIAEAIGRSLENAGLEVDVQPIDEAGRLTGYDALVLGSGVYAGRWLRSARRFVESHADEIAARPTWLFSSGPIGSPPKPEADAAVSLDEIIVRTRAQGHRVFAGKLEKSRLRFADRAVITAVRSAEGDFRDWDAISAWAREIAGVLTPTKAVAVRK